MRSFLVGKLLVWMAKSLNCSPLVAHVLLMLVLIIGAELSGASVLQDRTSAIIYIGSAAFVVFITWATKGEYRSAWLQAAPWQDHVIPDQAPMIKTASVKDGAAPLNNTAAPPQKLNPIKSTQPLVLSEKIKELYLSNPRIPRYVAMLSDGTAVGFSDGEYRVFESVSHFRQEIGDNNSWTKVTNDRNQVERFFSLAHGINFNQA